MLIQRHVSEWSSQHMGLFFSTKKRRRWELIFHSYAPSLNALKRVILRPIVYTVRVSGLHKSELIALNFAQRKPHLGFDHLFWLTLRALSQLPHGNGLKNETFWAHLLRSGLRRTLRAFEVKIHPILHALVGRHLVHFMQTKQQTTGLTNCWLMPPLLLITSKWVSGFCRAHARTALKT